MDFAGIGQRVEGNFVGARQAVVQDGLGLIHILVEEVGPVDERTIAHGQSYIFYFEGDHIVVAFGGLGDVVLMIIGADVVEDVRSVVDIGLDKFFEEMGGGYINFRGAALIQLLLLRILVQLVILNGSFDVRCIEDGLQVLDVLIDFGFVADVFGLSRGVVFLLADCSYYLLQLYQLLLEGLELWFALYLQFEFLAEFFQSVLEPDLVELAFQQVSEGLVALGIELVEGGKFAVEDDVVEEDGEVVLAL